MLAELQRFARYAPGWERLGTTLEQLGKPDAAAVALSRAASGFLSAGEQSPADAALPLAAGRCLRRAGRPREAADAFIRALSIDPAAAETWFSLGLARQDLGDLPGAATAFIAALDRRPDFHEAAFNLGVARQEIGDLAGALTAYRVAYRTRPQALARIAQALVSGRVGRLWLGLDALRNELA